MPPSSEPTSEPDVIVERVLRAIESDRSLRDRLRRALGVEPTEATGRRILRRLKARGVRFSDRPV